MKNTLVLLLQTISWSEHINKITNKANSTRAFLQRNLNQCQPSVKSACYTTYIHPTLEYASPVWSPHLVGDINRIEMVQRRSARFVNNNFNRTASVTLMLNHLNWPTLELRRNQAKLHMFIKLSIILYQYHMTILSNHLQSPTVTM